MKKVFVGCVLLIILLLGSKADAFSTDPAYLGTETDATEYQFQGQGINGMPFAGRNTGLIKLTGSIPGASMDAYCLDMDALLVTGAYYSVQSYDDTRIKSLLMHAYPIVEDLDQLQANLNAWLEVREIAPAESINVETAVTAAQIAIWHIACGLDIGLLHSDARDEVKMAHYLLAASSIGAEAPDTPRIETELVSKLFSPTTRTFDAIFTYKFLNQSGQAVINPEKTNFSGLPENCEETIYVNGDTYMRLIKGIPDETVLVLNVNAETRVYDIFRLTSENSQELVGIQFKTIEVNKYIREDFTPPPEQEASAIERADAQTPALICLPAEASYGLAVLIISLAGLLLLLLLRERKKKAGSRKED